MLYFRNSFYINPRSSSKKFLKKCAGDRDIKYDIRYDTIYNTTTVSNFNFDNINIVDIMRTI